MSHRKELCELQIVDYIAVVQFTVQSHIYYLFS